MPKRDLPSSPTRNPSLAMDEAKHEGVEEPGVNDVISGRGDTINRHPGNVEFRKMVEEKRRVYLGSHFKREKRLIAETIVTNIQAKGGRFLSKDPKTGLWFSIGWDRAREKASQALRENSKKIRLEIQKSDSQRNGSASAALNKSQAFNFSNMGKQSQYEHPHYPHPPTGPAWGYPYYYGYGSHHQLPPFPHPVYACPPHPPTMTLPLFGGGYPEAHAYGGSSRAPGIADHSLRNSTKQDRRQRTESDDYMDSSGSSDDLTPEEEPEHLQERNDYHHDRGQDLHSISRSNSRTVQEQERGDAVNTNKRETDGNSFPSRPAVHGVPNPPAFPGLYQTEQYHTKHLEPTALKPEPPKSPRDRPSPIVPINYRRATPEPVNHKLTSSPPSTYTIRSPHFGGTFMRGGPFGMGRQGNTLTPRGGNSVSALDEILASPVTEEGSSMGYTGSNSMDSPFGSSPCSRNSVPFSPIHANMDMEGHPHLKPRPFYR